MRTYKKITRLLITALLITVLLSGCGEYMLLMEGGNITFDSRGGTAVASQEAIGYVMVPETTTKEGYTFTGWYCEENCENIWDFEHDMIEGSLTLYAGWSADTYTVTYAANGAESGTVPAAQIKIHDSPLTLLDNSGILLRNGYTFGGWCTTTDGNGVIHPAGSEYTTEGNATLYAKWDANGDTTYREEYWLQDVSGSGYTEQASAAEARQGTTGASVTATTKSFTGFTENTSPTTGRVVSGTITGDGSLVLKRYYDRNTYTVSFESNGGTIIANTIGVRYGAMIAEPAAPSKDGYTFNGWYSDAGFTTSWTFGSSTVMGNKTIYAKWTANGDTAYREEYWLQEVSGSDYREQVSAVEARRGTTGSLVTATTKSFTGFHENTSPTTGRVVSGTITGDESLVLKRYYDRDTHTVTFESNGGTSIANTTGVRYGATIAEPAEPSKDGHTFNGWYSDAGFNTTWTFASDTVIDDMSIYAKWTQIEFTVSFESNGGSNVSDITGVIYDATITEPSDPTKPGYTFIGWYEDSALTDSWTFSSDTVTEDVNLHARWQANSDTPYREEYWLQNLTGTGYTQDAAAAEDREGTTGDFVTATTKSFTGFSENTSPTTGRVVTGTIAGNGSLVLKRYYDRDTYTVTFESNGGSSIASTTGVRYGATISEPATPTRSGYDFIGWFEDAGLTDSWTFASDTVDENKTLYAKWLQVYTISYDANGATSGTTPASQEKRHGLDISLAADPGDYEKDDKIFYGWNTSADGSGTDYAAGATYSADADLTLYVKWEIDYSSQYTFETYSDRIEILYYLGSDTEITVPSSINGKPVTALKANTFNNKRTITSITLPDSLTYIGERVFQYCTALTSIVIPDNVTTIGEQAFGSCTSLSSVTLSDNLETIGYAAFHTCTALLNITLPDSVTTIESLAFGKSGLWTITIPNGVTVIPSGAFDRCPNLWQVALPSGVTTIGDGAFSTCNALVSVNIPDSTTSIGQKAFYSCNNLQTVTLPENLRTIGADAFFDCDRFTTIVIPDNVTTIGENAFSSCSLMVNAYIGSGVSSMGRFAFNGPDDIYCKAASKPDGWDIDWYVPTSHVFWEAAF